MGRDTIPIPPNKKRNFGFSSTTEAFCNVYRQYQYAFIFSYWQHSPATMLDRVWLEDLRLACFAVAVTACASFVWKEHRSLQISLWSQVAENNSNFIKLQKKYWVKKKKNRIFCFFEIYSTYNLHFHFLL